MHSHGACTPCSKRNTRNETNNKWIIELRYGKWAILLHDCSINNWNINAWSQKFHCSTKSWRYIDKIQRIIRAWPNPTSNADFPPGDPIQGNGQWIADDGPMWAMTKELSREPWCPYCRAHGNQLKSGPHQISLLVARSMGWCCSVCAGLSGLSMHGN